MATTVESPVTAVAAALRAEVDYLEGNVDRFDGWKAVSDSLLRIADQLESLHERRQT
jgi:hypothetical protein